MLKRAIFVLATISALGLEGCAQHYYAYGPPPPRVEYYGSAPGPGFVWIDGYWNRGAGGWVWVGGQWSRPPRPHGHWVRGHYVRRHGENRYEPGHWRY